MWRRQHPWRERYRGQTRSAARRIDRAAVGAASQSYRSRAWSGCSCCCSGSEHPERDLPPVIHVAGTNGKGSTIAYLRAILEAAHLRVHVYTSPSLVRINECFRLGRAGGGTLVGDEELRAALEHCERANAGRPSPCSRLKPRRRFCLFTRRRPTSRCWRSARRPARCPQCDRSPRSPPSSRRCRHRPRQFLGNSLTRLPTRKRYSSSATCRSWSRQQPPEAEAL